MQSKSAFNPAPKKSGGISLYKSSNPSTIQKSTDGASAKVTPKHVFAKVLSPLEETSGISNFLSLDESVRLSHLDRLLSCITSKDGSIVSSSNTSAISDIIAVIATCSFSSSEGARILNFMVTNITSQLTVAASVFIPGKGLVVTDSALNSRSLEGGLFLLQELLKAFGRLVEPFAVPLLGRIFSAHSDKSATVRDCASCISSMLAVSVSPHAFRVIFPMLVITLEDEDWKKKVLIVYVEYG